MMTTQHARLQHVMHLDNTVHVQHYRDASFAIYQNYSSPVPTSDNPLTNPSPGILGVNQFHLFRIVATATGAETLGQKIGSYTSLQEATQVMERTNPLNS
jgi:hypothetical protein